jgi:GntR family transcriptional regulator
MTRLKRNHPLPLYVQLYDTLRADINARRLKPHQQLPSERELCARFRVSRMTIRQALVELTRDGLIYSRAGKGTFVSEPKIDQQLKTLTGFTQDMRARGNSPSSRVLEAKLQVATDDLAQILRAPPGTETVLLSRVRLTDGVPLAVETVHLPHSYCPNLLRHDFAVESLYDVLEREYGHRLTRAEQTIEAALASPRDLALLQLAPPAPVLVMERLTFTDQDVLIEYVQSTYRGDRYKFRSALATRSDVRTA